MHMNVSGGTACAFAALVNSTFLTSWTGNGDAAIVNQTRSFPRLQRGNNYVLTVLVEHMGHNGKRRFVGYNEMKSPRGILEYPSPNHTPLSTNSSQAPDGICWKITDNLGREDNLVVCEGRSTKVQFIRSEMTTFDLDIPKGWDVPLSFVFNGDEFTGTGCGWRAQLWVNGYQFGKFANGIGPQRRFPVPEGIFNYRGKNTVAISIWALEEDGATPKSIELVAAAHVEGATWKLGSRPTEKLYDIFSKHWVPKRNHGVSPDVQVHVGNRSSVQTERGMIPWESSQIHPERLRSAPYVVSASVV
ncbi:glycosyl hydrolase family 35 [Paraphaeosphaeria sporulosa]